jgi:hypothetical protein
MLWQRDLKFLGREKEQQQVDNSFVFCRVRVLDAHAAFCMDCCSGILNIESSSSAFCDPLAMT